MARNKMSVCKSCGKEIAGAGKVVCPSCGRVNKKPIYKRTWFIVLAVIFLLGAMSGMGGDDTDEPSGTAQNVASTPPAKEAEPEQEVIPPAIPIDVTTDVIFDALDENALKASNTYKDQYVRLTGKLSGIDAQGKYFSLSPMKEEWTFDTVTCRIEDSHLNHVLEFKDGQEVTVIGTITDVGEFLGYTLKVESIE